MKVIQTKEYFNCEIYLLRDETFGLWLFDILDSENNLHQYRGLPNKCFSKASALKRAWYRSKWLKDGSHNKRYLPIRTGGE